MAKLVFLPSNTDIEVEEGTKVLAAAKQAGLPIRFGCGSGRCGTCAVRVDVENGEMSEMKINEQGLLREMNLPADGSIRLSCQARIKKGVCKVDLSFQSKYSPDVGLLSNHE